mgnify:CR=1 FL=1
MRSVGVGDGNVHAEPEPMKVVEKEIKTVYLEPEKPEQRNVGLQVRKCTQCIDESVSYRTIRHLNLLRLSQL